MTSRQTIRAQFATPIHVGRMGDDPLCSEVTKRLVAESRRGPSVEASVFGGWHGPPDLAARVEPPWQQVTRGIVAHVRASYDAALELAGAERPSDVEVRAQGWGAVLRRGAYSVPHDHRDAHWSAVWYASAGDPPPASHPSAGCLAFVDPRGPIGPCGPADVFPRHAVLAPERGMIVVFPGWLCHFVHPYLGRRPRVSVAYNVMITARP